MYEELFSTHLRTSLIILVMSFIHCVFYICSTESPSIGVQRECVKTLLHNHFSGSLIIKGDSAKQIKKTDGKILLCTVARYGPPIYQSRTSGLVVIFPKRTFCSRCEDSRYKRTTVLKESLFISNL